MLATAQFQDDERSQSPSPMAETRTCFATFVAAGVTPIFVGDAQTDALHRLLAREVVAAPFLVGRPIELTDEAATLSRSDLRLLELPLDLSQP